MALAFCCSHCSSRIVVRYLSVGECAKCPSCGQDTMVPENAENTDDAATPPLATAVSPPGAAAEQKPIEISNPFFGIWHHPRETIAKVIAEKRILAAVIIAAMYGIGANLLQAAQNPKIMTNSELSIWQIVLINTGFGIPYGLIIALISAAGVTLLARIFRGKGNFLSCFIAVCWSWLPLAFLIIMVPIMLIFPNSFSYVKDGVNHLGGILLVIALLLSVAGIWTIVISVNAISVTFSISNLKSVGILVLWGVIAFILLIGIIMISVKFIALVENLPVA